MGYKASPEILQIITLAIAGVTTVVRPLWAAPPMVRVDVWIDDIRIAGSKSDMTLWETQVLRNADCCHASMGEDRESGATQHTFLGVQFGHTHRAVSLSDNFVRSVRAMPALNPLTIAEMEVVAPRFLYAAAILGTRLCVHCFLIKAVRRRLSALNRGIVLETSPANVPSAAVGLGERLRHIIENTTVSGSSSPRRRRRPPSRMHRSMDGEPLSFQIQATLKPPEGVGRRSLFLSCRPRRARYAWPYRPFPPSCHPPWTFGWTTLRCKELRIKAAQNRTR
ncbi:mucin-associated surface protein (MASP) [Trypanosoma cruzi]|nr:mucin-associated surface protein (MASP) [Trypanosoma cruzi]